MKRKGLALVFAALLAVSTVGAALADGNNPNNHGSATTGDEGHPDNQSHNEAQQHSREGVRR